MTAASTLLGALIRPTLLTSLKIVAGSSYAAVSNSQGVDFMPQWDVGVHPHGNIRTVQLVRERFDTSSAACEYAKTLATQWVDDHLESGHAPCPGC